MLTLSELFYEEYVPEVHDLEFQAEFDSCRDVLRSGGDYLKSVLIPRGAPRVALTTISLLRTFVVHGRAALEDLRRGLVEPGASHMRTLLETRLIQLHLYEDASETAARVDRYLVCLTEAEQRHLEKVLERMPADPGRAEEAREGARVWKGFVSRPEYAAAKRWVSAHNGRWHPYSSMEALAKHFSADFALDQKYREFSSFGSHLAHPVLHLTTQDGSARIRSAATVEPQAIRSSVLILLALLFQGVFDAMEAFDPQDPRLGQAEQLRAKVGDCLTRALTAEPHGTQ